jgi:hypothetical protein
MTSAFRILTICAALLASASSAIAKTDAQLSPYGPGGVGSVECLRVQQAAQAAVLAGLPYSNHGQLVSTAAHVVSDAEDAGTIDAECASCIVNQFARRIPIEDQTPCGEETRVVADLLGPETGACDGPVVGSTSIQELENGDIEFRLVFVNGPASTLFNVFWVGTAVANGCHNDATGNVNMGQVTTDAAGQAVFVHTLIGGNPFPGEFVHIDACVPFCSGPLFTSLYADVPAAVLGPTLKAMAAGDPTKRVSKPEETRPWTLVKGLYR